MAVSNNSDGAGVSDGEQIVTTIVQAAADLEGVSPLDLPPLYDALEPEQVSSLRKRAPFEFQYIGYTVTVFDDRTVVVNGTSFEEVDA